METKLATITEKVSTLEGAAKDRMLQALAFVQGNAGLGCSLGAVSILLDLGLDADTVIAALLLAGFSDRLLPAPTTAQAGSRADFAGQEILLGQAPLLVQGVRKIDCLKTDARTSYDAENIRNMLFALTDDIRAIIIRLAEKLDAMRVLDSRAGESGDGGGRKAAARECLDIYVPLADRLGISWIKDEMEDLSLKFLNRETYQQIKSIVAQKREQRNLFLELARKAIGGEAEKAGLTIQVKSRAKHFYSVYMKMRKRGKPADKILDLAGIRIICDSIENCYTLLGIVHNLWKPLGGSFKDYIARPKPNGYQSLHTAVAIGERADGDDETGDEGRILEIQIRTGEMHDVAENGIASHWLYKKGPARGTAQTLEIGIANRLKGWKEGTLPATADGPSASGLWLEEIKLELFRKWIYVFTPQGKVVKLPAGATPIDFAYQVHTAVGERCLGAKANGSIVPLSSQLKNTQTVEILTSPSAHPSPNWLQVAKSSKARNKIRSWLEKNDESFMPEKSAADKKKSVPDSAQAVQNRDPEPEAVHIVQRVVQPLSSAMRVRIEDEKNLMIRFARCCNPVTGDSIVGYVSRGRGIIIHRRNCAAITHNPEFGERKIEAEWENTGSVLVKRFRIEAKLSANLFSEIEGAIRKWQGHLIEGRVEETSANRLGGVFTMQLTRAEDLKPVIRNIRGIPGILAIQPVD
ncbi:MAG: HD domain-containing protein [Treponema sp.]|nr:HD domain-containing protein [Treponema sp.]